MKKYLALLAILLAFEGFSQQGGDTQKSNIQTYTPSKLLKKGQWDIKFFNNLYTQTRSTDAGSKSVKIPRETYFTNTTEIYTGVSNNSRINVGIIFQLRSNTIGGAGAFDVFLFRDNNTDARTGLTTIAPSVRVQPFKNIANFSFTSSVFLPIFKDNAHAPYLDKRSVFWETKFYYDKTFGDGNWQIFTEADLGFNFGEKKADAGVNSNVGERFANNSLFLPFSTFLSYFPSKKTTVFVNAQQAFLVDLGNNFSQNYTSVGFGGKYQLTQVLNVEASVGKFIRGHSFQGLGEVFNIGLRALF